ncbi:MAG: nicotinate-nucleotide adenylyltransferase [Betaproteobacteria bacterium]|nr:nicotinate-nucleotide adenylyltransferase [Betaproteobacteria bacterium]
MAKPEPLGLLGGSFDPIHYGHLRFAEEAISTLGLARVRLIPAGVPKHRATPHATAAQRLAMVEIAAAGNPRLSVDPAEVLSDAPSYTVPTLERLRQELGAQQPLVLLLGADAFAGLASWHRWEALISLAHIGVASRPGHALNTQAWPAALAELWRARSGPIAALREAPVGRIVQFDITPLDISATAIRALLARRASPRYLLPDALIDYIALHRLYSPKEP